jgi:hypothetical protein
VHEQRVEAVVPAEARRDLSPARPRATHEPDDHGATRDGEAVRVAVGLGAGEERGGRGWGREDLRGECRHGRECEVAHAGELLLEDAVNDPPDVVGGAHCVDGDEDARVR